jgi:hypothetical protein
MAEGKKLPPHRAGVGKFEPVSQIKWIQRLRGQKLIRREDQTRLVCFVRTKATGSKPRTSTPLFLGF